MNNVHTINDFSRSNNPMTNNRPSNIRINPTNSNENQQEGRPLNKCKECLNIVFPFFSLKTWTFSLIILNLTVYLVQIIFYYAAEDQNWDCTIYRLGAKFTPAIRHDFQIYRLITPIFLHSGIMHILFNTISLLFMGFSVEHYFGGNKFLLLYFLSGIFASSLSALLAINSFGLGASGAISGM
jgi:membrane associated rhomboid family serine protease